MARVLITTLGRNWEIVPEILGWTNPDLVDFYRYHPHRQALDDLRVAYGIEPVEILWIITTDGPDIDKALQELRAWRDAVRADAIRFRVVQVRGIEDLSSLAECRRMREAIHQVVFRGFMEAKPEGMLVLSLTGGRKTMSSDMQAAAAFFGCRALVHLVGRDDKLVKFKQLDVQDFCRPLASNLADAVTPVVVGRHAPSTLMDYPESLPRPLGVCVHKALESELAADAPWVLFRLSVDQTPLLDTLEESLKAASNLAANHASRVIQKETSANFLALYSLPPRVIQKLKETKLGVDSSRQRVRSELELLRRLPKAELHCHLGGALTVEEMIDVARGLEEKIKNYQTILEPWLDQWKSRLESEDFASQAHGMDWKGLRRPLACVPEPIPVAAFIMLFQSCPHVLEKMIYGPYLKEENFVGIGFNAYERLGDLQGSALLQCEETLRAACRMLGRNARDHHVLHLEVRCSPHNYTRGGLSARRVMEIIADELAMHGPESTVVLLIGSRHKKLDELRDSVALAEEVMKANDHASHMLVGFDLAGDEKALEPVKVRETFLRLMERCLHATIHAGEIADASSIWQAVYHLNAERIGHGLTLQQNPDLLERFRDRRIAVEMCPSSNCQIVGFQDAHLPRTASLSVYPLADYLQKGLRVTVNTDNPGISRTDFSKEYHRAGRLTPNGLSLWDVLVLIRNGFKAAFTEAPRRHDLLRKAENMILQVLEQGLES